MLAGLAALLSGGATGILGLVFQWGAKYLDSRQAHAQSIERLRMDMEVARIEGETAAGVAAVDLEGKRVDAEASALRASYREAAARWSDGKSPALVWVDFIRGLTRPAITLLLISTTAAIYTTADGPMQDKIISSILYLTAVAVTWWFGSRPPRNLKGG